MFHCYIYNLLILQLQARKLIHVIFSHFTSNITFNSSFDQTLLNNFLFNNNFNHNFNQTYILI